MGRVSRGHQPVAMIPKTLYCLVLEVERKAAGATPPMLAIQRSSLK